MSRNRTYGDTTIDAQAVQLGDSYSYNYTTTDASDAIYHNTAVDSLRAIAYDEKLRIYFLKIPLADSLVRSLKHDLDGNLETLSTYLRRVQVIEQHHINSSNGRELFASVLNDTTVAHYITSARSHFAKLSAVTQARCSGPGRVTCLDNLCDQVRRLEKQMAARMSLDRAIEDLPAEDEPEIQTDQNKPVSEYSDALTPVESPTQPFRDLSQEQEEYLYATQDLWRQFASVLEDVQGLETRCWIYAGRKVVFYIAVFTIIYLLEELGLGSFSKTPGESNRFLVFFKIFFSLVVTFVISNIISMTAKRWRHERRTAVQLPNV